MKRKAQAALEFLMTYGWAFLVILVMIGALAYFGVLNPTKLLPERCTVTAGFQCSEFQIDSDGQVQVILSNGIGSAIVVDDANVTATSANCDVTGLCNVGSGLTITPTDVPADGKFSVIVPTDADVTSGDKVRFNLKVGYTPVGKTIPKSIDIEVFGEAQ